MLAELIFCGVSGFAIGFFLGKMSGRGGRKYEEILHEARRDGYMDAIRAYGGDTLNNKEFDNEISDQEEFEYVYYYDPVSDRWWTSKEKYVPTRDI